MGRNYSLWSRRPFCAKMHARRFAETTAYACDIMRSHDCGIEWPQPVFMMKAEKPGENCMPMIRCDEGKDSNCLSIGKTL
jgi:hypothetical protein